MLRVVCISDTHSLHADMVYPIPYGEILIHAGDISNIGELHDIRKFANFFRSQPHKYKIVIGGNHDFGLYRSESKDECRDMLSDFIYLENQEALIKGIKFYGSPITPAFCRWAFMEERGEKISKYWNNIPDDTNVLITHGPPYGVLDLTYYDQEHAGCEELKKRIDQLKDLKVHVYGHIHEQGNVKKIGKVLYINASICNLKYDPVNKPIVFDIDEVTKKVKLIKD